MVKNPNWQEADQLAEELNLGLPRNNSIQWSERDLNPEPQDFKSGTLTTRPRCLNAVGWRGGGVLPIMVYKGRQSPVSGTFSRLHGGV